MCKMRQIPQSRPPRIHVGSIMSCSLVNSYPKFYKVPISPMTRFAPFPNSRDLGQKYFITVLVVAVSSLSSSATVLTVVQHFDVLGKINLSTK